jgi:hypothetical protein
MTENPPSSNNSSREEETTRRSVVVDEEETLNVYKDSNRQTLLPPRPLHLLHLRLLQSNSSSSAT